MTDKKKRNQYLIFCIAVTSGLGSLLSLIVLNVQSPEKTFCETDIIPQSNAHGANLCAVQGALNLYFVLGCCFSWVLQSLELFLKVLYNKSMVAYWRENVCLVITLPLVSVSANAIFGLYGYGGYYSWCFVATSAHETVVTLAVYYIPVMLALLCVLFSMCAVIYKIILAVSHKWRRTQFRSDGRLNSLISFLWLMLEEANKYLSTSVLFLVCLLAGFIPVLIYGGEDLLNGTEIDKSWTTWVTCVFTHFDGVTDASWQSVCGTHPTKRANVLLPSAVLSAQSIMVSVVFFPYLRLAKQFCGHATSAVASGLRGVRRMSSRRGGGFHKVVVDSDGDEKHAGQELIAQVAHGGAMGGGGTGGRAKEDEEGENGDGSPGESGNKTPPLGLAPLPVPWRSGWVSRHGWNGGSGSDDLFAEGGRGAQKEAAVTGTGTGSDAGRSSREDHHSSGQHIYSPNFRQGNVVNGAGAGAGTDSRAGVGPGALEPYPLTNTDAAEQLERRAAQQTPPPARGVTAPVASRFWPVGGPGPETGHSHGHSRLRSESYYMESVGEHASLYDA